MLPSCCNSRVGIGGVETVLRSADLSPSRFSYFRKVLVVCSLSSQVASTTPGQECAHVVVVRTSIQTSIKGFLNSFRPSSCCDLLGLLEADHPLPQHTHLLRSRSTAVTRGTRFPFAGCITFPHHIYCILGRPSLP